MSLSAVRVFAASAAMMAISTAVLLKCEPGISMVDAIYLSAMVYTTIGYGDIAHPSSAAGRIVVMCLSLGGIACFATTIQLFHKAREATDGQILKQLGLDGAAGAFAMLAMNVVIGTSLCQWLSDATLPKPGSILDGAYWTIITGTTVGFGDFYPTSDAGKLATVVFAFLSLTATSNAMDVAGEYFVSLCSSPEKKPRCWSLVVKITMSDAAKVEELKRIFQPLAAYIAAHEPTTLAYSLLLSDKDPLVVTIFERYADKEKAFLEIHRSSAEFKVFREALTALNPTIDGHSFYEDDGDGFMAR